MNEPENIGVCMPAFNSALPPALNAASVLSLHRSQRMSALPDVIVIGPIVRFCPVPFTVDCAMTDCTNELGISDAPRLSPKWGTMGYSMRQTNSIQAYRQRSSP